ncbi:MAG: hypothetical protein MZV64_11840 [Ignavibacteriales bacterium]|nr:hypothetical protein [Ignavibacteriales bacterium]
MKTIDVDRVKAAIAAAERATSGEIRVSVARVLLGQRPPAPPSGPSSGWAWPGPRTATASSSSSSRPGRSSSSSATRASTPRSARSSGTCVAGLMSGRFPQGRVHRGPGRGASARPAAQLAAHFPYDAAVDVNELADDVDFGDSLSSKRPHFGRRHFSRPCQAPIVV